MHTFIHSFNTPMPAHARLCWAQGLKLECCIGPELQPVGKKCSEKQQPHSVPRAWGAREVVEEMSLSHR